MTQAATSTSHDGEARGQAAAGLLEQVLDRTPEPSRERVREGVQILIDDIMKGAVTYDKNVDRTINGAIAEIDRKLSEQLAAVMHHEKFSKLEGTWRGLHHLVMKSETGTDLKIKVFNVSKRDLYKNLADAAEFDQSDIFKKIYSAEFDMPGGTPYASLIGDYQFENHPEDLELLDHMSHVAAAGFCPFITSPSPKLFGFESFPQLANPRDLAKIFDTVEYAQWKSFRESEDSRFVVMSMPRALARLPYGKKTKTVDEFDYEEVADGKVPHEHYCWMNAAYVLGAKLTDAFAKTGWCTAIRGRENGGAVEGLPSHTFLTDEGDVDQKCPTEIAITERRENELTRLGFLPLCHYKDSDFAVFFGAQTAQKPKVYEGKGGDEASANARLSASLPYIMATSRVAHYLKVMVRDWIGSFKERDDLEKRLSDWIANYVLTSGNEKAKAEKPFAAAQVVVEPIPGKPGFYHAVAHLRPWLQLEELTMSLRLVAELPKLAK